MKKLFTLFAKGKKSTKADAARLNEVIVYTYDSFCGEWGSGPEIAKRFEAKTGMKVTFIDCGDGVQILSKAQLEKKDPYADVLLGLDNNLTEKAAKSGVFETFKPANADVVAAGLEEELGGNWLMTPYDYSPFAIIWNSKSGIEAPKCLEDLTKDIYKKKIILMDARTSTPGLGFETWVNKVYGKKAADYMKRLTPSILTMAPGWSVGYGMFTDGHVMQVEGAGLVKGAKNPEVAKKFIEFLISEDAQNVIPTTQWMYPSNKNVKLPACYDTIEMPEIIK